MATNYFLDRNPGSAAALFGGASLAVVALVLCSAAHYDDTHTCSPGAMLAAPLPPPPPSEIELLDSEVAPGKAANVV